MEALRAAVGRAAAGIPPLDWATAGALAVFALVEVFATEAFPAPRGVAVAGALVATLPLAWRRRWPLEAAMVAVSASFVAQFGHSTSDSSDSFALGIALLVALYSLGAYTHGWQTYAGAALVWAAVLVLLFTDRDGASLGGFATFSMFLGGPWVAGRALQALQRASARRPCGPPGSRPRAPGPGGGRRGAQPDCARAP